MEGRDFFSVFPKLNISKDLKQIFEHVKVLKVASNHARTALRVYTTSDRLIEKKDILAMQNEIAKQVVSFLNSGRSDYAKEDYYCQIIEKYELSSQYNLETLYDAYYKSMLEELHTDHPVMYHSLKNAGVEIDKENQTLKIKLLDYATNRARSIELKDYLEKVFGNRFQMPVHIDFEFEKQDNEDWIKERDLELANEIHFIDKNLEKNRKKYEKLEEVKAQEKKDETVIKKKEGEKKDSGQRKSYGSYQRYKNDDPSIIYGRDVEGEEIEMSQIIGEMGLVVVKGMVFAMDTRELRSGKYLLILSVTDFTDSIMVKMFLNADQYEEIGPKIAIGGFFKFKGVTTIDRFDSEIVIGSVSGIKVIDDFRVKRFDASVHKRVELNCHTMLSDMDGVVEAADIIKQAISFGHKALAITDNGCVQGFTEAYHALQKIQGAYKKKGEKLDFKLIYGMDALIVDDLQDIMVNDKGQSLSDTFVVFDIETTGFSPVHNKIIEIGAVKVENNKVINHFETFINPEVPIPLKIEELTSISDSMVMDAPKIESALPEFLEFCKGCMLIGHNANFDVSFIREKAKNMGIATDFTFGDTMQMARFLMPALGKYTLDHVAKNLNIGDFHHHRAVDDADTTAKIFMKFVEMFEKRGAMTLKDVNQITKSSPDIIKKSRTSRATIIATNEIGRINLYHLVSDAHLTYYRRDARVPKSEIMKFREGLLIGSGNQAGELYRALLLDKDAGTIANIVQFYDYLELQPLKNNEFMIASERSDFEEVQSIDDIIAINKRIVALGEEFGKPVVATGDVHYLEQEDEIYRRIIKVGKKMELEEHSDSLFLRTTEEMLSCFDYLPEEKAYEIVVKNSNLIADMCDPIEPVRPDKAPPVIEDSDNILRRICYDTAHKMYGPELPEIVSERLEHELNSIISNGFAVMYIIAQKLVWKANEDGYLVGSRGSVGSSFVATMSGITEVNPLRPHYRCPNCFWVDFSSETVEAHRGGAGVDLPDAVCPECGTPLIKDGFDIPFETFLGFYGDKEPDIDLNFSGEYQSKAHAYTEVIFGKGQTFRAGTIGKLQDKTAFGFAKKYFEEQGESKRKCEMDRMVRGCVGVRRTTGQHPGGIVVLPIGEDINSFTPIQHPADDMNTPIITTHFDYHSIDHNLLKLDILGHDDPTIIRMLQDLTGVDPLSIPLDDPGVMSLFKGTEALGVTPEDLRGCPLGCLGVPEFGTDFVIGMVQEAKPEHFSDLVRISGLSHGTDVWLNNAQSLIKEGLATISTCICTRDDIMTYLINKGVPAGDSFKIMESVRKGRGLTDEYKQEMIEHDVPDWYIQSCLKIQYMFPKAHAAAYVMMAYRIAWFKINHPLAYYAAYFSIRAKSFKYDLMCQGQEKLEMYMDEYEEKKKRNETKPADDDIYKDMKLVQEMYARGFEFVPIDIFTAHAHRFQIVDGKLMAAIDTIDGLGDKAADGVEAGCRNRTFLSKEEFRQATGVGKSVTDAMTNLGLLNLPESNQLSLFDMM